MQAPGERSRSCKNQLANIVFHTRTAAKRRTCQSIAVDVKPSHEQKLRCLGVRTLSSDLSTSVCIVVRRCWRLSIARASVMSLYEHRVIGVL